jgi:hypothetical protein
MACILALCFSAKAKLNVQTVLKFHLHQTIPYFWRVTLKRIWPRLAAERLGSQHLAYYASLGLGTAGDSIKDGQLRLLNRRDGIVDGDSRLLLQSLGGHCAFGILGAGGQIGELLGESLSYVFSQSSPAREPAPMAPRIGLECSPSHPCPLEGNDGVRAEPREAGSGTHAESQCRPKRVFRCHD